MPPESDRYREAGWWTGERLVDRFESHVHAQPDAMFLVSGTRRLTRSELWEMVCVWADQISRTVDDRKLVVIHLPNKISWLAAFLATLRAGHVPATTPITTTVEHLQHIVDLTHPAAVISCPAHRGSTPIEDVVRAVERAATSPAVLSTDDGRLSVVSKPGDDPTSLPLDETTEHIMFTSSTTGPPKAVSHSDDSLATLNRQFAERFALDDTTPILMPSPLGHSVGAIHGARLALYLGSPLILQDEWDPVQALELVAEHRVAFTSAATPFLLDLLNAEWDRREPKLAPLRSFLCGGAQVPPALVERCRDEFPNTFVTPLWGMTEGGLTTCTPDTTHRLVASSVGFALPDLELMVIGDDGVGRTEGVGELAMRGPGVFNGYYGQPGLYDELTTPEGYFRTGDLAEIDADGYVSITGRLKDLIIRGAVNISPVYTENVIAALRGVEGVAVIGWPDERLGERLCAVVQSTVPLELPELLAHCEAQDLDRRYWPERLERVDRFPRTAAGKIRKQQLRDELLARRLTSDPSNQEEPR
ncbi:MAG: AMP-binding protein [Actinomycetia bacterium]|nr:AMP-binding protein [Actinomycetes bacterium]